MELASADNSFTRISPRQWQEYRLRTTYRVASWVSLSGSVNVLEKRNNVSEVNNLQHNRMYGWSAIFDPSERVSLEVGYDYSDDFSQILVCFVSSTAPGRHRQVPGLDRPERRPLDLHQQVALRIFRCHVEACPAADHAPGLQHHQHHRQRSLSATPTHRPDRSTRTTTGRTAASTTPLRKGGRARPIGATTAITKIRVRSHKTCLPPETSAAT